VVLSGSLVEVCELFLVWVDVELERGC